MFLLACLAASAAIVDRIAVVAAGRPIKDSEIERELRIIDFLNGDPLEFTPQARKKAADRLIDQAFLRREVEAGGYAQAGEEQAREFLRQIRSQRYGSDAAYRTALARYGITEDQLLKQLRWQLTVLNFIDQRFRVGAVVAEADARKYYESHAAQLRQAGKPTFESSRPAIEQQLAGERVNQQFNAWLDDLRKRNRVEYHEEELR